MSKQIKFSCFFFKKLSKYEINSNLHIQSTYNFVKVHVHALTYKQIYERMFKWSPTPLTFFVILKFLHSDLQSFQLINIATVERLEIPTKSENKFKAGKRWLESPAKTGMEVGL